MRLDLPLKWLLILFVFSACVADEERVPDSAGLRDPWFDPAVPSDVTLAAGRQIFASCASCHLADASGRPDGTIPRLAGQPAVILEARLRALQDGSVYLPVMIPFARALTATEVHQVSAYLGSLPTRGADGLASAHEMDQGARIYSERCQACHAARGLGQPEQDAPRLCGQHEAYLVRRMDEIVGASLRPTNQTMRAIVGALSSDEKRAVSGYLARVRCDG